MENYLYQKIENLKISSKIIGLRKQSSDLFSKTKLPSNPFLANTSIEIKLTKIDVDSEFFTNFILNFSNSEKYTHSKEVGHIKDFLLQKIKLYKIREIDLYTLTNLLLGLNDKNYDNCENLSSFYIKYFESKNLDLNKSSEIAFKLYNNPKSLTDLDKNNPIWWKILKHQSVKEFLVAYHIFYLLKNVDVIEESNLEVFNHVYPVCFSPLNNRTKLW